VRVIVTGSRNWRNPNAARQAVVDRFFSLPSDASIVVGYDPIEETPRGIDRFAYQEAQKLGLKVETHPARWARHDRDGFGPVRCYCQPERESCAAAGFRRNQKMVDMGASLLLVFWNGKSKGTRDCQDRAVRAGIPIEQIEVPQ
jgi:hypothetical protein